MRLAVTAAELEPAAGGHCKVPTKSVSICPLWCPKATRPVARLGRCAGMSPEPQRLRVGAHAALASAVHEGAHSPESLDSHGSFSLHFALSTSVVRNAHPVKPAPARLDVKDIAEPNAWAVGQLTVREGRARVPLNRVLQWIVRNAKETDRDEYDEDSSHRCCK